MYKVLFTDSGDTGTAKSSEIACSAYASNSSSDDNDSEVKHHQKHTWSMSSARITIFKAGQKAMQHSCLPMTGRSMRDSDNVGGNDC